MPQPWYYLDISACEALLLKNMRPTHRHALQKSMKAPLTLCTDLAQQAAILPSLYAATMQRVGAGSAYHFSSQTIEAWLNMPQAQCWMSAEGDAAVLCFVQQTRADYFLFASSESARTQNRALLWTAIRALKAQGVRTLSLGGGVRAGDALDQYKRGWGGAVQQAYVSKLILQPEAYKERCTAAGVAAESTGYFPPYLSGQPF